MHDTRERSEHPPTLLTDGLAALQTCGQDGHSTPRGFVITDTTAESSQSVIGGGGKLGESCDADMIGATAMQGKTG